MFQPEKADNLICEYLENCYVEPGRSEPEGYIYHYISGKYEDLVSTYGWQEIQAVVRVCTMQMCSEDEEANKKAVARITKDKIFEIASTVSFLAGMAFAELQRHKKEVSP